MPVLQSASPKSEAAPYLRHANRSGVHCVFHSALEDPALSLEGLCEVVEGLRKIQRTSRAGWSRGVPNHIDRKGRPIAATDTWTEPDGILKDTERAALTRTLIRAGKDTKWIIAKIGGSKENIENLRAEIA